MCGLWCFFGHRKSEDRLVEVTHRGPDDHERKLFACQGGDLELAHWRLSILDLSPRGRQPMSYANGRYQIVFNGEIYNYRELREELRKDGASFQSECDTEVILAAYHHWGGACLTRFLGMFAFCLWDRDRETLFVARDRFGIKPLYYFISPHGVAFASEIKQFAGLGDFRPRANLKRLGEFLAYGLQDHTTETMHEGVRQLRGGESALIHLKEWRAPQPLPVRTWYTIQPADPFEGTFEEASRRYRDLFFDVIRLHLRSDVRVGSCLSGGMDSSAIVCAIHRILSETGKDEIQNTFSCCFDEPECDERPFMRAVAEHTGVHAHFTFPQHHLLFEQLERRVWHQDEPFNDTSVFAQFQLFADARQAGVKVMLDGQGADEQLASYPQFFGSHLRGMLARRQVRGFFREAKRLRQLQGWTSPDMFKSLLFQLLPGATGSLIALQQKIFPPRWLNMDCLAGRGAVLQAESWNENEKAVITTDLSKKMLTTSPLPMLLHWEDRNSMAHGVETRVPFLDHRLVEFTLGLPDAFKTKIGVTKRILRSAMADSMPEKVLKRTDKMGFATPEERWFRNDASFRSRIIATARENPGILSESGVQKEIQLVLDGRKAFSHLFWRIITFGIWMKRFNVEL